MILVDIERDDVCVEQLDAELVEAEILGFSRLVFGEDSMSMEFVDGTTAPSIDQAQAIVDAHVPTAHYVKMHRYIDDDSLNPLVPPADVSYMTGITVRLHPTCSVVVDGEVRKIDYYAQAEMDMNTGQVAYSDLVVSEEYVYTRDAIGFARSRQQTITWIREDDTPHPATKVRVKLYEPQESLREGQRRRTNITDKLAMDMSGWLLATQTQLANPQDRLDLGRDFMATHKISFDMFIEASSSQILYDVRDDDATAWLDDEIAPGVTIRATILDALNIWNLTL